MPKPKDLAKAVGVAERTLRAWFDAGCPRPKRGQSTATWRAIALDWRGKTRGKPGPIQLPGQQLPAAAAAAGGGELLRLQERRLRVQIEREEADFAERRKLVVSREEVEVEWARREFAVRTALLQLPQVLVKRCTMAPGELISEEATTIVHEILEAFAEDGEFTPRSGLVQPGDPVP